MCCTRVQTRRSRTGIGMHFSKASVRDVSLADIRVFWARWYNTVTPARMEAKEVVKRMSRSVFIVECGRQVSSLEVK